MRLPMKTMSFTRIATAAWIISVLHGFSALSLAESVRLCFDPATPQTAFAVGDIKAALQDYLDLVGVGEPAWREQE